MEAAIFDKLLPLTERKHILANHATPLQCMRMVLPGEHLSRSERQFARQLQRRTQAMPLDLTIPITFFFSLQHLSLRLDAMLITDLFAFDIESGTGFFALELFGFWFDVHR